MLFEETLTYLKPYVGLPKSSGNLAINIIAYHNFLFPLSPSK
jgi:hypothetical protein